MSEPRIPPIYPSGANSIEARVKALETARWYDCRDMDTMKEDVASAHQRASDLARHLEEAVFRAAVWAIAALLSTVATLALIIVRLKAPWILSP